MPRDPKPTRERILKAASRLFYGEGVRAVGVDAVAEAAGVTKKTLYYHFASKDDLIAAYLEARDAPNRLLFQRWLAEADGALPEKIRALFDRLAAAARRPGWKGCGFQRAAAELAATPGHPAVVAARAHKRKVEEWLAGEIMADGREEAQARLLARQIALLIDGAFAAMLLHRDPSCAEAAGAAAAALLQVDSVLTK